MMSFIRCPTAVITHKVLSEPVPRLLACWFFKTEGEEYVLLLRFGDSWCYKTEEMEDYSKMKMLSYKIIKSYCIIW